MKDKPWNFSNCKLCSYRSKSSFVICKHENLHQTRSKTDVFTCYSKPPELYPCEFCGFETNLKVDLTEHFRVFHEGKEEEKELKNILKCFRCKNGDFETHSLLVLMNHADDCNTSKQNKKSELLETVKSNDPHSVFIKANVLSEHSYSRSLHQHLSSKFKNLPNCAPPPAVRQFQCEQCEFKCRWQSHLRQHTLVKHTVASDWVCGQCDYQCKYENYFKQHLKMKHGNPAVIKWFQCEQCEFKCRQKGSLKRHILVKHTQIDRLKCEQCDFECKHKYYLNRHINNKHCNPAFIKWFRCEQCAYKSKRKSCLKYHISVKHVDPKDINWLECGQCDFKCKFWTSLKQHSVMKHGDPALIKWFQCEQCGYKCKENSNLKRHISVKHTEINWIKCEQCDFKCKYKHYLKRHVERKHLNPAFVKWFPCEQCEHKSKDKGNLKQHILAKHQIRNNKVA